MTVPTFVVAGAARSGTTGLVEGLRTHPRVFVTDPKEPHYFALHRTGARFTGPGDHTVNRLAVTDRDRYLALYPRRHDYLALGDASVSTLYYHQESLPELVRMNPRVRVVVLLREPVARAFSSHQYLRARGLEPVEDFLEAVALEEERKQRGWHHLWHYTGMSHYAEAIAAVQAALPADQIGIWFHDDLEADFVGTVASILRFLDVPPADGEAVGVPRVNVSGSPRHPGLHGVLTRAAGNDSVRALVKAGTTFRFRERVRRTLLRSDPVPATARAALTPLFRDDARRLRVLLAGPVPAWLREEVAAG